MLKFRVWDKDKKVMHQADEICRIHLNDGLPYGVLLWDGEILFNFVLHLGNNSLQSVPLKKRSKKGGGKDGEKD